LLINNNWHIYVFYSKQILYRMLNKKKFFPLTYSSWDNQEIKAINKIINSGQLTYSNQVKKFESKFAHHMQMKYGIMVNSGSSANLLSIAALFYKKKTL